MRSRINYFCQTYAAVFSLVMLAACGENEKIRRYSEVISKVDSIVIYRRDDAEGMKMIKSISKPEELERWKTLLTSNIEQGDISKFFPAYRVDLYGKKRQRGTLLVSGRVAKFVTTEPVLHIRISDQLGSELNELK